MTLRVIGCEWFAAIAGVCSQRHLGTLMESCGSLPPFRQMAADSDSFTAPYGCVEPMAVYSKTC